MIKKAVFICIILMVLLTGTNLAQEAPKKWGFSVIAGVWKEELNEWRSYTSFSFMGIGGFYPNRNFGIEITANRAHRDDLFFSGNLLLGLPVSQRLTPFLTFGWGLCIHGEQFSNLGGGLNFRIIDQLTLRAEYRNWIGRDNDSKETMLGGFTYSFN
jgi:hypothetical protein